MKTLLLTILITLITNVANAYEIISERSVCKGMKECSIRHLTEKEKQAFYEKEKIKKKPLQKKKCQTH